MNWRDISRTLLPGIGVVLIAGCATVPATPISTSNNYESVNATVISVRPVRLTSPDAGSWRTRFVTNQSTLPPPQALVEVVVRTDDGRLIDLLRPPEQVLRPGDRISVP